MPRDTAYLVDILLHARDALSYTSGIDKEGFLSDSKTYNAVIRCLEVIGEAVKRISAETRWRTLKSLGQRWPECGTFLFMPTVGLIWIRYGILSGMRSQDLSANLNVYFLLKERHEHHH